MCYFPGVCGACFSRICNGSRLVNQLILPFVILGFPFNLLPKKSNSHYSLAKKKKPHSGFLLSSLAKLLVERLDVLEMPRIANNYKHVMLLITCNPGHMMWN